MLASGTKLNTGLFIALGAVLFSYLYLRSHSSGYSARMAGDGYRFAHFAGIRARRSVLIAMLLSGGAAGLAGAIEVLGVHYRFVSVFSGGGSFDGVAVALLGGAHPLGVPIAALLLAGLRLGATNGLQLKAHIPRELGEAIIAMMMVLVSIQGVYASVAGRLQTCIARVLRPRGSGGRPVSSEEASGPPQA